MHDDKRLSFGKHKGERLADIPVSYLDWMLGEDFPDELKKQILEHLEHSRKAEWEALSE